MLGRWARLATGCLVVAAATGCGQAPEGKAPPSPSSKPSTPPLPADCRAPQGVFSAAATLAASDHDCAPWVELTAGRVLRSGRMSGVVWTTQNEANVGLLLSAVHTLGEGWFAKAGAAAPLTLKDPGAASGVVRLELTSAAAEPSSVRAPFFMMFNPAIPAEETGDKLRRIRPRHDFFLAAMDGQRFEMGTDGTHLGFVAVPLQATPPQLSDPGGMLTAPHRDAAPGDRVLMVGYPHLGPHAGSLAASVGVVLDAAQVETAMGELRAAGDEEGELAYDPEVEHIVRGAAVAGMSGGGVFDAEGHLIGVLVRGSTETKPPGYVRFVRLPFIAGQLSAAFLALPEAQRAAIRKYLPPAVLEAAPTDTP